MKTKLLFAFLSYLFLLSLSARTQQAPPQMDFMKARQTPMVQRAMKTGMKTAVRSFWEGQGACLMAIGLFQDSEIRTAFGISDEQFQKIQGVQGNMFGLVQNNPEFKKIEEEMRALRDPNDPFMQNADEATMDRMTEIQGRMTILLMGSMSDAIDNVLTADQKQKMLEAQLASMGEMPIIASNMFDALDLTDTQRRHMEKLKKELEPEFEKNLESFSNNSILMVNKLFDEFEKQGFDMGNNPEEIQQKAKELQEKALTIQKKLMAEDPEFKMIQDELQNSGKSFATKFKTKMFDVLNDEQWARLQVLIDNPPAYARALLIKLKEQSGQQEQASGGWQPGSNSWKPGDPIPEEYRQERSKRRSFFGTE